MFRLFSKNKILSGSSRTVLEEVPKDHPFPAGNRGMTFIELIVVIGIFATVSGVVLFNFTGFTTNISLQNLANQIALQLKKSQTQALSGTGGSALFGANKPSYGIHFDTTKPDKFIFFADLNNDGQYTGAAACGTAGAECVDEIFIKSGDRLSNLFVGTNMSDLDVTFKRPFPDARFFSATVEQAVPNVGIEITSSKGLQKTIIVWTTGQIEIKSGNLSVNFSCPTCQ
jgi:prepilin-type N-terminal cleavage/methylation domain-containing protein